MSTFVIMNNLKNKQITASELLLLLHSGRGFSQLLSCQVSFTIVIRNGEIWTKVFDWRVKIQGWFQTTKLVTK